LQGEFSWILSSSQLNGHLSEEAAAGAAASGCYGPWELLPLGVIWLKAPEAVGHQNFR
jgi:hypothetical protein